MGASAILKSVDFMAFTVNVKTIATRNWKGIQYDIFSGFLTGRSETEELLVDFNEKLFHRLVDYATVYSDGRVVFTFRNGVEVSTEI